MTEHANFGLNGKTALVIGGSSGIGREIALAYRDAGATVLIAGQSQDKLDAVRAELGGQDGTKIAYSVDARDVGQLRALRDSVRSDHGGVDILVNCQGTTAIKPALELSESEYDGILDTNLKSVFFACTLFGEDMMARDGGTIINIASLASHNGWSRAAAYSASKWGVVGITKSFAAEWGMAGVRVNAIAPGFFLTDLNRAKMPEERKAEARRRAAMNRMGDLQELVGAAIYLASSASGFVTGSVLNVDGGYLASGI